MNANWFKSPLAGDAVLAEPLKRALAGKDALRVAVRALLLRRCLGETELAALERTAVNLLDVSHALGRLEAELLTTAKPRSPTGHLHAPPFRPDGQLAPRPAPDIAPETIRVIVRAMGMAVRAQTELGGLCQAGPLAQTLGLMITRVLAEDLFPVLGNPDPNADLREAVGQLLGDRRIDEDLLASLNVMDRQLLAQRLEGRHDHIMTVAPPASAAALERLLHAACELLRRRPPVNAAAFNQGIG